MTTREPGASEVLTHGLRVSPRAAAFLAIRPAPTITEGLDVLVHDVIAAIVTAPWPMVALLLSCTVAVAVSCSPHRPKPRSFGGLLSVSRNARCMSASAIRSCGRFGPARLGTTVDMSSFTWELYSGVGTSLVQNRPWAR